MTTSIHHALRLIVCLALNLGLASVSHAGLSGDLSKALQGEIKRAKVSSQELGIFVADDHGVELFSLNAEKLHVPASLTKMLTAVAAIDAFSPGEKFVTSLVSSAAVNGETLEGPLYFKGGGDPSFVSEKMWYLVNEFTRTGVKEISGGIVVDDTLFDTERIDPGRDPGRVNRAYDAPIGAASFNWNSINIFIRPGKKAGESAQVVADPVSNYIKLISRVTTSGKSASINIERVDGVNGDTLKVTGNIPVGNEEIVKYVSISKPDFWTGYHLVEFLKQRGITVKGGVSRGKAPANAKLLAKSEGAPLYEILADMLKFSNNYVAEMLTKQLAVKAGSIPASMGAGIQNLNHLMARRGLTSSDFTFTSPSGLSQKNKIKPRKLGELLVAVRKDLRAFPEVAAGLPIAGIDGTLKSRMKGTPAEQKVRGKTGLLTGAIGLSGYAARRDGTTLTYVFIYNGGENVLNIWSLFDSMAARLVE